MKLNSILLEGDPVAEVKKALSRRMKEVFSPHKDLKQMEKVLKSAISLSSGTIGGTNNAYAIAIANKLILDILWSEMQIQKGRDGSVEDAFEGAFSGLVAVRSSFTQSIPLANAKQGSLILDRNISDAAKLILRQKLNG